MNRWGSSTRPAVLAGLLVLAAAAASGQSTRICAVQGSGPTPSGLGSRVTLRGIVTGSFVETGLRGFFLQDPGCDRDPATSDGLWVDVGSKRAALAEGHTVLVTGRVSNPFGLTTLELDSLVDEGPGPLVEAVALDIPADPGAAAGYLEAREGMLVALPTSLAVAATNAFGEAYVMPESSRITRLFRGDSDGRKLGLAEPARWLALDQGDRVLAAIGPLTYTFGEFKLMLRAALPGVIERSNVRPTPLPPSGPEALSLASYNLLNLFDPVDDPGIDDADVTPSPAQYAVGLARRARSLSLLGLPDVVGVQEIEKLEVLQDLAVQPELASARYGAVLIEGIDPRGIDVGLLYRSDRLRLLAAEARPACTPLRPSDGALPCPLSGGQGYLLFTRPPLVARLEATDGERLTVIVNHFRSQRGGGTIDDRIRLAMADHVRALVEELKAAEPTGPVVVMGDLNDFEDSPPLQRLTADGRLVNLHTLARQRPYTYAFQGIHQVLDHILVEAALLPRVVEAGPAHVNVDFAHPAPGSSAETSPRSSDHDPMRLLLRRLR